MIMEMTLAYQHAMGMNIYWFRKISKKCYRGFQRKPIFITIDDIVKRPFVE